LISSNFVRKEKNLCQICRLKIYVPFGKRHLPKKLILVTQTAYINLANSTQIWKISAHKFGMTLLVKLNDIIFDEIEFMVVSVPRVACLRPLHQIKDGSKVQLLILAM